MDATDERVAVVTGASKGLGAAIARRFAAERNPGRRLRPHRRQAERGGRIGSRPDFPVPCDVTQSQQVNV